VHLIVLFLAAFLAGAINSVAGGGTLLTFPALLAFGVPAIAANATSTLALVPGSFSAFWRYRGDLAGGGRTLLAFAVPSLVGGVLGALAVDRVGDATFARLVPWLIFGATALFVVQAPVRAWMLRRMPATSASASASAPGERPAEGTWRATAAVMLFQLAVATYGGFFGAGMGILMLAALGILGLESIHRMNGVKNFAAVCINGVAALTFVALGRVRWPLALLMATGAVLGGWIGAGAAKQLGEKRVRAAVVAIGAGIGLYLLIRSR
jgi:hypothetical protein